MGNLELDTELRGDIDGEGRGRFTAQLSNEWEIWGPNGGYLATFVLRAAGKLARLPRPVSLHVHYLRVAQFAEVTLHAEVLHAGRQAESIAVRMEQGGKLVLSALVRTAHLGEGLAHHVVDAPEVSAPELLPTADSLRKQGHRYFRFWDNYERRVLQPASWVLPRTQLGPRWLEWFRYRVVPTSQCAFLNAGLTTILIDTLCWPAAWLHHVEERYIAPSLDLTVWFHRPAPAGWLLVDAHSPAAQDGLVAGSARVFDGQRNLIASGGSALLCVPLSK